MCTPTELPKTVQKAHRYGLASIDMQEVIEYLDAYDQLIIAQRKDTNEWFHACKGVLCAAIVAYCRPFSKNQSQGFADRRLVFEEMEWAKERLSLHLLLFEKRDTMIAHADWKARSAQILHAAEGTVWWHFPQPDIWDGLDLSEFRRLASDVYRECLDKGVELANASNLMDSDTSQPS